MIVKYEVQVDSASRSVRVMYLMDANETVLYAEIPISLDASFDEAALQVGRALLLGTDVGDTLD